MNHWAFDNKRMFNRTSFAMTYRFSIKKESTSVAVIARYEAISFWVSDNKRMFNRSSFAMTYRFFIKKETTSVSVIARHEAISSMDILNQKIASVVPLSQ
jgi:hypothetical protein